MMLMDRMAKAREARWAAHRQATAHKGAVARAMTLREGVVPVTLPRVRFLEAGGPTLNPLERQSMSDLILPRRRFLTGLATLFAAPAIVRVASLMAVKVIEPEPVLWTFSTWLPTGSWRMFNQGVPYERLDPKLAALDYSTEYHGGSWTDDPIPLRPRILERA